MPDKPDLPRGWHWSIGEGGEDYYFHPFATNYDMGGPLAGKHGMGGYMGTVDTCDGIGGKKHVVTIEPVVRIDQKLGDCEYGYPVAHEEFETAEEAHQAVPEIIGSL